MCEYITGVNLSRQCLFITCVPGNNEELDEGDNQQVLLQQIDELEAEENEGAPSGQKTAANIPDFLPAAQRALFLRIQQKQQEEEEKAKRRADSSQQEKDNEEGKFALYIVKFVKLIFFLNPILSRN